MKDLTYYIPISSSNLAHYFGSGIIAPVQYYSNRIEDLQNIFPNHILLSKHRFTNENNSSLEVVLTEKEELSKISDNFFLLRKPIPISRIKKVFFRKEKQSKVTGYNINVSAAYFPEHLVSIDAVSEEINTDELYKARVDEVNDWEKELKIFDRLLGGFAVMQIAKNHFSDYSREYFGLLSQINTLIKSELDRQEIHYQNKYSWLILNQLEDNNKERAKELIYSFLTKDEVLSYAKDIEKKVNIKNGKLVLNDLKFGYLYLISVLASYGEGTRMNLDTFFSDFKTGKFLVEKDKEEGIALSFGINKGYKAFSNEYKTSNFKAEVKFKLDTQLDYYTIESIYQYAFNHIKDNKAFEYIDYWCPKRKEKPSYKGYKTYDVLDIKVVYEQEKVEELSFLENNGVVPQEIMSSIKDLHQNYSKIQSHDFYDLSIKIFELAQNHFKNEQSLNIKNKDNTPHLITNNKEERNRIIDLCEMNLAELTKTANKAGLKIKKIQKKDKHIVINQILDLEKNRLL